MSLKRAFYLLVVGLMLAGLFAACGDSTPTSAPATTAAATTAAPVATTAPVAATTAAPVATTAPVVATTAPVVATTAPVVATTAPVVSTAAVTTAVAVTTAATTAPAAGGASDLIEVPKFDATGGKKGGQVTFAFAGQFPTSLMPYYIGDNVAIVNTNQIYAKLVGQSNNSKYYGYLLKDVPTIENGKVKVSADGKSFDITLELKPGLKWSDGSALTSKDIAYTVKWVNDPDNAGLEIDTNPWSLISAVETPNDTTAVLKFKSIYGPYISYLSSFWPLPEKTWSKLSLKDGAAQKSPEATVPTVTSGPMKAKEFTADDRIILERNDNFAPVFGFNAYLDRVVFKATTDAATGLVSVGKGEIDEIENLDDNLGEAASKVPGAKFDIADQYSWEYMVFNLTNPIFQDAKVRKGLELAIDKQALIKQFRTPKTTQLAVTVSSLSPFADKSLTPSKFDPEGAKKLLDDAGWKPGSDGIRAKDGKKLTFTLSSTTAPVRGATAEVMLKYWKDVGVDAKFQAYKSTEFFGSYTDNGILARGKFDLGMFAQVGDIDPAGADPYYRSTKIPTDANKGNGNNYGRVVDPAIDKALDEQAGSVDQAKRKAAWFAYQKALYDNTWEIPLYTRVNNYVASNKIANFKANPTTDGNFWNVFELYLK